jgi:D-alanyl-D-alanine carboxypeptidase
MEKLLFILFLLAPFSVAFGLDPYEDTAENLAPQVEHNRQVPNLKARAGTWTFAFELIKADGTIEILSEQNRSVVVKPASTMKLFTSWFAYKSLFRDNVYLAKMLKESVNEMADTTLKSMGGTIALKAFYAEEGLVLNTPYFIQADGSGLSYDNKTNCATEIDLLKLIHRDPSYNEYKALLAQPGEEGTLKERLLALKGTLFAKTGTLNKTASLTGFVETNSGTLLFCILTDYLPGPSRNYRPKIDAMVIEKVKNLNL